MLVAFFARVLKQFIAFRRCIGQSGIWSKPFGLRKQAMAPFQDGFLGQVKFAGQVRTGLALHHAAQQQDKLSGPQLTAFKDRAAVECVHTLAGPTAVDRQATAAIAPKEPRLGQMRLAMRTAKAVRMKVLLDPGDARLGIE